MLYSMTGFGRAEATIQNMHTQIEIRTLNSRGLDLNIRTPQLLKHKEVEIRNILAQELQRGKIDVHFSIDMPANQQASTINADIFTSYLQQLQELTSSHGLQNESMVDVILKLPNVLMASEAELSEESWNQLKNLLLESTKKANNFRLQEGKQLEDELRRCITQIATHLKEIPQYEQERVEKVRERMVEGLRAMQDAVDVDQNKLEQELIFYIEKFDITEEKVRLSAHLDYFLEMVDSDKTKAKGKKLNFISQEIGREINTIGSKANHLSIQKHVVEMKDHLEQIKEQLSNIL